MPLKSLPVSIQTSQPLINPSLQHNLTALLNILLLYISYMSYLKSKQLALLCPLCTSPYLSGLESHLGPVLHVSVPALLYVPVPAQLLLARLHVSVPTSCSDFDLTLDKLRPTMCPLSYDFSVHSIRIRIHVPQKDSTIKTRFSFSPFPTFFSLIHK